MTTLKNPQRRTFMRMVGLSTAAAGAAASVGQVPLVQADNADTSSQAATPASRHYRETDHVRAFYASLRD